MRIQVPRRRSRSLFLAISAAMVMALVAVYASFNTPGVTPYLELEVPQANVGFDGIFGGTYDWANSGANSIPRDCPTSGSGEIQCTGTGGVFDGGIFIDSTTPPTKPHLTPAAAADSTIVAAEFGVDPLSVDVTTECGLGDPTVYTGVGSETNGDDLNTETFGTGSVPNKDEISNVYAISHQDPPNPSVPGPDDTNEIFAGFERVVNNGDSHVDLEFLQADVITVPGQKASDYPCAGKFQGHRSEGDLLLSVDFTKGGSVGTPILHKWVCGDYPAGPDKVCDPVAHPGKNISPHYEEVSDVQTALAVKQTFNSTGPIGCGGWACRNADGTQTDSIGTVELYEVGIDLAAVGFEGCINTFLPHTRSSQSFTSVLKDFELIRFNTCNPSTVLTKSASASEVVTGDSVTYTYKELNDGNVSLTDPSVTDDQCSPVSYDSGDTNTNGILDPTEEWTYTCTLDNLTADVTNTAIGHGTWTLGGQSLDVTYCDDPASPPPATRCDQDEWAQATVNVLNPSTTLTKTASATVVTTVAYTYYEHNDGQVALSSPFVEDPECVAHGGTIAYVSGDDGNGILDPLETWVFTCTATYNGPGDFTNTAIGHGSFTVNSVTKDVTVCPSGPEAGKFCDPDETDMKTVSVCTPTVSGGK